MKIQEGDRRNPTHQERADRLFERGRVEVQDPLRGSLWLDCQDGIGQSPVLIKIGKADPSDAEIIIWSGGIHARSRKDAFTSLMADKPGITRSLFEETQGKDNTDQ